MAEVTTYKCDVCGNLKREANHWMKAAIRHGERLQFTVIPWAPTIQIIAASSETVTFLDLCGMECSVKAMTAALTPSPEKTNG